MNFFSKLEWAQIAIALSSIQAILMTSLEAILFSSIYQFFTLGYSTQSNAGSQPIILVYFVLFMFAQIIQLLLSVDAQRNKNTMQVLAVVGFNIGQLIYSIIQFTQLVKLKVNLEICSFGRVPESQEELNQAKYCTQSTSTAQDALDLIDSTVGNRIAIIILMLFFNIAGVYVAWKVYGEYGWSIVRRQGADLRKLRILQRYHTYILLLKTNIYFFLGVAVQFVTGQVYKKRNEDLLKRQSISEDLTSVTVPLSLISLVVFTFYYVAGYFGIKRTNYTLMGAFLLITLAIVSVGFYLLGLVVENPEYAFFQGPFILFSLLNAFLNIATFLVAVLCIRDFKLDARKSLFADLATAMNATCNDFELVRVEGKVSAPRTEAVLD